jgi:hypothetical protein
MEFIEVEQYEYAFPRMETTGEIIMDDKKYEVSAFPGLIVNGEHYQTSFQKNLLKKTLLIQCSGFGLTLN